MERLDVVAAVILFKEFYLIEFRVLPSVNND